MRGDAKLIRFVTPIKVNDYLRKSSLIGTEIFMVVFSHEREEDYMKI